MGHTLNDCDIVDAATLDLNRLPYGQWLRAGFFNPRQGGRRDIRSMGMSKIAKSGMTTVVTRPSKIGSYESQIVTEPIMLGDRDQFT